MLFAVCRRQDGGGLRGVSKGLRASLKEHPQRQKRRKNSLLTRPLKVTNTFDTFPTIVYIIGFIAGNNWNTTLMLVLFCFIY